MNTTETIRTNLIDKILAIRNVDFLKALDSLVANSSQESEIKLSDIQKKMLQMSERDISSGSVISQKELDQQDIEWLKGI